MTRLLLTIFLFSAVMAAGQSSGRAWWARLDRIDSAKFFQEIERPSSRLSAYFQRNPDPVTGESRYIRYYLGNLHQLSESPVPLFSEVVWKRQLMGYALSAEDLFVEEFRTRLLPVPPHVQSMADSTRRKVYTR